MQINNLSLPKARICYDHLAGEMGVMLYDRMLEEGWLGRGLDVTNKGWTKLAVLGLQQGDLPSSNRPLYRACLDWSQRRHHPAGRLGKAVLDRILAVSWARRLPASRVIVFHLEGERRFDEWLG